MNHMKILVSLLMAFALSFVGAVGTASADSKSGTVLADLDSYTGAAADTTDYHSSAASVAFSNADTAKVEMDEFTTLDMSFYVMFEDSTSTNVFQIEIENDDDSDQTITIKISMPAATTSKVEVDDSYGDEPDESATKTISVYDLVNTGFALVEIDITKTSSNIDGSKQKIEVAINGTTYVEMDLDSPELTSTKERSWDQIVFTATMHSTTTVDLDDWNIDADPSKTYGFSWTMIFGVLIIAVLVGGVAFGMGPAKKYKKGRRRKRS